MDGDCGDDCQAEQKQTHLGHHPNRYTPIMVQPTEVSYYLRNIWHIQQASTVKQSLHCIAMLQHTRPQTKTCMQHIFHATLALHSRIYLVSLQVLPVLAPIANLSQSFIPVTLRHLSSPAPTQHITSTACKAGQTAVYLYFCMHQISKSCSLDLTLGGYQISSNRAQC